MLSWRGAGRQAPQQPTHERRERGERGDSTATAAAMPAVVACSTTLAAVTVDADTESESSTPTPPTPTPPQFIAEPDGALVQLGEGAHGVVYLAKLSDMYVAVKVRHGCSVRPRSISCV